MTIDNTLPAGDPLRFRKKLFLPYKMTLTEVLKIPDCKIKADQGPYDLDKEVPKISALSSKEPDKYEYSTGKYLTLKTRPIETKQIEYSQLTQTITKAIKKDERVKKVIKFNNGLTYDSV